jgi:hypothetical protein
MFLQFVERLGDLRGLLDGMDPATREVSREFCGVDDDQGFGTYGELLIP